MEILKRINCVCVVVWLVGITGLNHQLQSAERVTPQLNTETTARVGGEVLHQGEYYQRAAIHLSQEIKLGQEGAYTLTPGFYVRTGESDEGWETYAAAEGPDAGSVKKTPGSITLQGAFQFSNDGQTIGVITNFYQAVNAKAIGVTRTTRPSLSPESIQRSLVYGGKAGTKIRLAYREIWKNVTRPSEIDFMEYDLADSKVVECHGARIEVIEATKESIRYRVIQVFNSTAQ